MDKISRYTRFSGVKLGMARIIRTDEMRRRYRRTEAFLSKRRTTMTIPQSDIQKGILEKKLNFMASYSIRTG
jgi:hypothetical protein